MIQKEINPQVVEHLGQYIQDTIKTWHNYVVHMPILKSEFDKWIIPKHNVDNAPGIKSLSVDFKEDRLLNAKNILRAKQIVNAAHYAPMSGMFWHTNNNNPGTRIYYTFALDKALFKYRDPDTGEIIEDWDNEGWTVRQFEVNPDKPFWHTVWSAGRRFTFGFVQ